MTSDKKINDSFHFVVRFYRPGAFRADRNPSGILYISPVKSWWRRYGIAASFAGVALLASAIVIGYYASHESPSAAPMVEETTTRPVSPAGAEEKIQRIEFTDVPLRQVVAKIEEVYGVKIEGLEPGDTHRLTLSYEGTATDLVDTINDTLGTNLTIAKR